MDKVQNRMHEIVKMGKTKTTLICVLMSAKDRKPTAELVLRR